MSLQPYLPPVSGEAGAVYALLQVITDPKAAKAALDKLVEEKKAIDNATQKQAEQFKAAEEKLSQTRSENEKLKRTADTIASKAAADLGAAKSERAMIEQRRAQIDEAEKRVADYSAATEAREHQLDVASKELQQKWKELRQREADISGQLQTLNQRQQQLEMREKTLNDDIAEHNKWLAGLKPPRAR